MMRHLARWLVSLAVLAALAPAGGCASGAMGARAHAEAAPATPLLAPPAEPSLTALAANARPSGGPASDGASPCAGCAASSLSADEESLLARRIAELKEKGGVCATYAGVLERSYRSGQITVRPYMWRVGSQLASGEARPDGMIFLAREIDALNVGRRTFDELLWTLEHEAAHIAFNLDAPFDRAPGDRADAMVKSCRG
ncbi:MAG: hypothetical protein IT359_10305 [Gemmatimonadaceae bacterium]|nr:hypothetical protein [Gemmatimonadaceae bacterium]